MSLRGGGVLRSRGRWIGGTGVTVTTRGRRPIQLVPSRKPPLVAPIIVVPMPAEAIWSALTPAVALGSVVATPEQASVVMAALQPGVAVGPVAVRIVAATAAWRAVRPFELFEDEDVILLGLEPEL